MTSPADCDLVNDTANPSNNIRTPGRIMRTARLVIIAICAAAASGCAAPKSETHFLAEREALIGSPALRQKVLTDCAALMRRNPSKLEALSVNTSIPKEKAPEIVCGRFIKAHVDGRYTYKDYVNAQSGMLTPENIRIAQGR